MPRPVVAPIDELRSDLPSSDLLPRIAAGDERAVRACVVRYGPLVSSLARRWCIDAMDAEDAVQEVFIDLWRTASRFDAARATEAGWIAMLTRRRLIDRGRRRLRAPVFESLTDDIDVADGSNDDPEGALDRTSRADCALAIVRALPPAQRRLLELSLLDGKTHDEIAHETSLPLGTVKSHIRRGLLRARALLATASSTTDNSVSGAKSSATLASSKQTAERTS
jgi:RNA polymerase sigma-70 factor (ECF subfamily)